MLKEKCKISDVLSIDNGIMSIPHTPTRVIGEVVIDEVDPFGNVVASTKDYNDLTIGGATFFLEQVFKTPSLNSRFLLSGLNGYTWNENLSNENFNRNYISDERIFGYMVGIGGEDGTLIKPADYTNRQLDKFVPFRLTIDKDEKSTYMMPTSITINNKEYTGYYVKSFYDLNNEAGTKNNGETNPIDIIPEYTDGSGVVNESTMSGTDSPIYTYARVILEIDNKDIREYFNALDGNENNCYVNQIGLVAGKPNPSDPTKYDDCKLVTICNFKSRDFTNDENTLRFTYKIYIM